MSDELKVGECAVCGDNMATCNSTGRHRYGSFIVAPTERRIAELEAALQKYGIHKNSCKMFPIMLTNPQPCTCGFDQALSGDGSKLLDAIDAAVETLEYFADKKKWGWDGEKRATFNVYKLDGMDAAIQALALLRPFARSKEG